MLKSVCFICCADAIATCFNKHLFKKVDVFVYMNIMC